MSKEILNKSPKIKLMLVMIFKILLLLAFTSIAYQDYKAREVHWFLFPIALIAMGGLFFQKVSFTFFLSNISINIIFISILLSIVTLYAKYKMNLPLSQVIGVGDIYMFLALAMSFASASFIVIFIFSLLFSLVLHLFLKRASTFATVPLAGYMSLFFLGTYVLFWSNILKDLYLI